MGRPAGRNILGIDNTGKDPVAIKISFKKPTSSSNQCDVDEQSVKADMLRVFEDNVMRLGEHALANVSSSTGHKISITSSANSESADAVSKEQEEAAAAEEDEDNEIF